MEARVRIPLWAAPHFSRSGPDGCALVRGVAARRPGWFVYRGMPTRGGHLGDRIVISRRDTEVIFDLLQHHALRDRSCPIFLRQSAALSLRIGSSTSRSIASNARSPILHGRKPPGVFGAHALSFRRLAGEVPSAAGSTHMSDRSRRAIQRTCCVTSTAWATRAKAGEPYTRARSRCGPFDE